MNRTLARYAAGRDAADDQPLTEAARVALEVNPIPRLIRMRVNPVGLPIEIPADAPEPLAPE